MTTNSNQDIMNNADYPKTHRNIAPQCDSNQMNTRKDDKTKYESENIGNGCERLMIGMRNLELFEKACENDLKETELLLDNITESHFTDFYREFMSQTTQKYQNAKSQIAAMRSNLQTAIRKRDVTISESEIVLCGFETVSDIAARFIVSMPPQKIPEMITILPCLRSDIIEESVKCIEKMKIVNFIRGCISSSKCISKENEVCDIAKKFGFRGSIQQIDSQIQTESAAIHQQTIELLPLLYAESDVRRVAADLFKAAKIAKMHRHYTECRKDLRRCWDLLKKRSLIDRQLSTIGIELVEILILHFGIYIESDLVLRQCLEIESDINPFSLEMFTLQSWVGMLFHHSGRYQEAEASFTTTLDSFPEQYHDSDPYWMLIYFLFLSYRYQYKDERAIALLERTFSKVTVNESPISNLVKLSLRAISLHIHRKLTEAESLRLEIARISSQSHPSFLIEAQNFNRLGSLYCELKRFRDAESMYKSASHIYAEHFPNSIHAAIHYSCFAFLYADNAHVRTSIQYRRQAERIFSDNFPNTTDAASNLNALGELLESIEKRTEAEEALNKSHQILSQHHPNSLDYAANLSLLGQIYHKSKRSQDAKAVLEKAQSLFAVCKSTGYQFAENYRLLGEMHRKVHKFTQSMHFYRLSEQILLQNHRNQRYAAVCLASIGRSYCRLKRFKAAERTLMESERIQAGFGGGSNKGLMKLEAVLGRRREFRRRERVLVKAMRNCAGWDMINQNGEEISRKIRKLYLQQGKREEK